VDPEPLIGLALQRRPDLAAVKLDLLAAEASVEMERTRNVPNLNLGGGYKRDFGQTSFFLGVELPLPIWDRREGAIRAEVAAGRRLANLSTWQELRIRHEVARACLLYSRLREATGRLEADFMNKLDRVVAITGLSYQQGEAGILEYLDSLRTERDAILAFNRLLKEVELARFELEAAVGAPLSGITP
jgi:cobalt-zinc-cadmium efflux system outer membrane protein